MDDLIRAEPEWHATHPGAVVGFLAMRGVANPAEHPAAERIAGDLERDLRTRLGGLERDALRATPPLPAYAAYYKRFGQRYHVALQLESVAQKGKPVPRRDALVTAMFAAELRHLILTAGHDLDALAPPVRLAVGTGTERYATPGGAETAVKAGDLYTADAGGVLSAIITGPAAAGRITPETTAAFFVAYAPPGVPLAMVERHLAEIEAGARLIAPGAVRVVRTVVVAGAGGDDQNTPVT